MKNLRGLRTAKGISMKTLGEALGLAESTISLYETGKREPDYLTLKKIADYFGVTIDFLLNGEVRDWDHESFYEDYERSSDSERLYLIEQWGLPCRLAADYFRIINSKKYSENIKNGKSSAGDSEELAKLEQIFTALSPEKQAAALEYLEYLATREGMTGLRSDS